MNETSTQLIPVIEPVADDSSFFQRFVARISVPDIVVIYIIAFVIWILFFLSYIPGIYSQWYLSLKQDGFNVWIPRLSWVVAGLLSYIGSYLLWRDSTPEEDDKYLAVTILYIIGNVILLAWSVALYQGQNIGLATWLSGILFIYQVGLFFIVWHLKPLAAILMIPLLALYLYLLYTMVHLASLNNEVL